MLTFEQDRFTAVDPPEIKLLQVTDTAASRSCCCSGSNLTCSGNGSCEAVGQIADRFAVG